MAKSSGMKTQLCNDTHNRSSFDYAHLATVADAAILMDKPLITSKGAVFKTNPLIKHLPHCVLWRPFVVPIVKVMIFK